MEQRVLPARILDRLYRLPEVLKRHRRSRQHPQAVLSPSVEQTIPEPLPIIQHQPMERAVLRQPVIESREQRMRRYQQERSQIAQCRRQLAEMVVQPITPNLTNEQSCDIREPAQQIISLTEEQLPWLEDETLVELDEIAFAGTDNIRCYYAQLIESKRLRKSELALTAGQQQQLDKLLLAHLPSYLRNQPDALRHMVEGSVTDSPLLYIKNPKGLRVYFTRLAAIDAVPVILKLGVCHKAQQEAVLGVFTTDTRKQRKK